MKKIFTILLFFIATLLMSQTIAPKKCDICGKPLALCQYRGRHPRPTTKPTSGYVNGHEWVDLGLPSGTKWATMNVGASSPSEYGSHFAWGETSTKNNYTWGNLKYCISFDGSKHQFSKYVATSNWGNEDGKKVLDLSDDAAYVNWGSGWRMPSKVQQNELVKKCRWTWTTIEGHNGYKVVGPNGSSIFLPAAGSIIDGNTPKSVNSHGSYWSSSLSDGNSANAGYFWFQSDYVCGGLSSGLRYFGCSVRPVCQ